MSDLQDTLDQIKDRVEDFESTEDALYSIGSMEKSQADVPRLVEALEAVNDHAGHALEQTANDSWDRGYDAACRKILTLLKGHLLIGRDDE